MIEKEGGYKDSRGRTNNGFNQSRNSISIKLTNSLVSLMEVTSPQSPSGVESTESGTRNNLRIFQTLSTMVLSFQLTRKKQTLLPTNYSQHSILMTIQFSMNYKKDLLTQL